MLENLIVKSNLPKNNIRNKADQIKLFQNRVEHKKIVVYPIIVEFGNYLSNIGYAATSIKRITNSIIRFVKLVLNNDYNHFENSSFDYQDIIKYEELLGSKVSENLISKHYRYKELHYVYLFCNYLYQANKIHFKYQVPRFLKFKSGRSNDYVQKELITKLCSSILSMKNDLKYRNLAIVLLMVDTGCRPIELCNLTLDDVNLSEKQITFYSSKSGQRKLKVHPFVIKILKLYMEKRVRLNPKDTSLFVKVNGYSIRSSNISTIFCEENRKAFNKILFSATSLRHTYATNALENKVSIKDVSEAMGHKFWESTRYYQEKLKKRLKDNTLCYNPFQIFGGDINGN